MHVALFAEVNEGLTQHNQIHKLQIVESDVEFIMDTQLLSSDKEFFRPKMSSSTPPPESSGTCSQLLNKHEDSVDLSSDVELEIRLYASLSNDDVC
jgi:hypothetical protein